MGVPGMRSVVWLLVFVLTCLASPETRADETEGRSFQVAGKIKNEDMQPLDGVTLEVGAPREYRSQFLVTPPAFDVFAETTSNEAGAYALSATAHTTQSFTVIRASKPGYATMLYVLYELMMPQDAGEPGGAITRDLVLPKAAEISGVVLDENNQPVAGAIISAEPQSHFSEGVMADTGRTTSAADGRFVIDTMPKGPVQLKLLLDGKPMSIQQAAAPATDLQLRVSRQLAAISGIVVNEADETPVAGATVRLYVSVPNGVRAYMDNGSVKVKSGADGSFQFNDLPAGKYVCFPEADGLYSATEMLQIPTVEVAAGETTSGLVLEMTRGATIYGTVYEAETSKPLAGAKVTWRSSQPPMTVETTTAADGTYRLEGVPRSEVGGNVDVQADGYSLKPPDPRATLRAMAFGNDSGRYVTIEPDTSSLELNLEMVPMESLSGTVVDVEGNPLAGVKVWAGASYRPSRDQAGEITGSDGAFTVPAAASRSLVVFAEKEGWPVASVPVRPGAGTTSGIRITVAPGGTISGMVLTPDGQPAPHAHIQVGRNESAHLTGMPGNLPDARSGADGRFEIKNLPAAKIQLFCRKEGYAPTGFIQIRLKAGERKDGVTLRLKQGYTIRGRVTDSAGKPVADARVTANAMDREISLFANTQTAMDGTYELSEVEDIPMNIQVWAPEIGANAERDNIRPNGNPVDFVLEAKR